jgi:hypothetical protein
VLAPSKEALDTPLSPPDLSDEPGPATGRSGAYPDRTLTGWPTAAFTAQHDATLGPAIEGGERIPTLRSARAARLAIALAAFAVLAGLAALVVRHAGSAAELAWPAIGVAALLLAAGMVAASPGPVRGAVALVGAIFLVRHDMRLLLAPPYGGGPLVMAGLATRTIELRDVERIAADAIGARIAATRSARVGAPLRRSP